MRFILPSNILTKLDFVRSEYQKEKQLNLDDPPARLGRPIFLGGPNIPARKKQIAFLEKMQAVLSPNLLKDEKIATPEAWQANLTASRAMIAACLYIQSQIASSKRKSVLYRLIDDDLGITSDNYLDEEDKEVCFLAAKRLITSSLSAFDDANVALRKANLPPFSEKEWAAFSDFLCNIAIKKVINNPYTHYPVTSITQPLFGTIGSYAGATIGLIGGDIVSHSTKSGMVKSQVAFVAGNALVFCGFGPAGIAVLVPAIAERVLGSFCSISFAHIIGMSMGLLGQGIGMGIGLPLDLAYRLLWSSCALVASYSTQNTPPQITGTRIADGMPSVNGLIIKIMQEDQIPEGYIQQVVSIKDGKWYLNNIMIEAPPTENEQLPKEVLQKIKESLTLKNTETPMPEVSQVALV